MWFKNATIYTLSAPIIGADALSERLAPLAFEPGTSLDMMRLGWVPPRAGGGLVHTVGQQYLIALRCEKKLLPASVVNQAAKARAQQVEEQQGFKPGRKQMREIKEAVTDELLPKSHSIWRDTRVWIDAKAGLLVVDSPSQAKCDEVLQLLNKSIDRLGARPLQTAVAPVTAMTDWLASDEAPAGFTVDQDTELRSSAQSKATVRYVRHAVETEDVRRHIAAGKQCTRLALTWADRISFVLTEDLTLKRITPLDVLRENVDGGQDEAERFNADFTLMAGELGRLIDDVVDALGGKKGDEP